MGAHSRVQSRTCEQCQEAFTSSHKNTRFCSQHCNHAHWRANNREKLRLASAGYQERKRQEKARA